MTTKPVTVTEAHERAADDMIGDLLAQTGVSPRIGDRIHKRLALGLAKLEAAQSRGARSVASAGDGVRPVVRWFAEQMEAALRKNDHKGGWHQDDPLELCERVDDELLELKDSLTTCPAWGRVLEAVDVGTMAMMVADHFRDGGPSVDQGHTVAGYASASAGDGRRYHRGALGIVDVVHESGGWVHYRAVGAKQRLPSGNFRSLYRECEPLVAEEPEAPAAAPAASAGDWREVSVYDMSDADYEQLEKGALAAWRIAYSKWAVDADNEDARGETFDTGVSFTDAREAYTDGYRTGYLSALESAPAAKPAESLAGWIPVGERLPEPEKRVLVRYKVGPYPDTEIAKVQSLSGHWYSSGFPLHEGDVSHWRPIPE